MLIQRTDGIFKRTLCPPRLFGLAKEKCGAESSDTEIGTGSLHGRQLRRFTIVIRRRRVRESAAFAATRGVEFLARFLGGGVGVGGARTVEEVSRPV